MQSAADKARLIMQSPDGHARYPLLPSISPVCPLSLLPGILKTPARLSAMHYGGLVCVLLCVCALIQGRLVCVLIELIEGLCVCSCHCAALVCLLFASLEECVLTFCPACVCLFALSLCVSLMPPPFKPILSHFFVCIYVQTHTYVHAHTRYDNNDGALHFRTQIRVCVYLVCCVFVAHR